MKGNKKKYVWLRRLARFFGTLLLFLLLVVLFIRSPWGQDIIVSKVVDYISGKTNTTVAIDKLFLSFSGNLVLEGLYLEDKKGDTLVHSRSLEANVPIGPIIWGNTLKINNLEWKGLTAHVVRREGQEAFNFTFLVDTLAPTDPNATTTSSEPMEVQLGTMSLEDFNVTYSDALLGIEGSLDLGELTARTEEMDLEALRFSLASFSLAKTRISYKQTKPLPKETDNNTPLPYLSVDDMQVTQLKIRYDVPPDSTSASVDIGDFALALPAADLSKQKIEVRSVVLKNSKVHLEVPAPRETDTTNPLETSPPFRWPEYTLNVASIALENNGLRYTAGKNEPNEMVILDPNAIALSHIHLSARDMKYQPKKAHFTVEALSFKEANGLSLRQLALHGMMTDEKTSIQSMNIRTPKSSLSGSLEVRYASLQDFLNRPGNGTVDLQLKDMKIALAEIFPFQPTLAENDYLKKLAQKPIMGQVDMTGQLADLAVNELELQWGEETALHATGTVQELIRPEALAFQFNNIKMATVQDDVNAFITEKDLGISLPRTVVLSGSVAGSPNDLNADITAQLPQGHVALKGQFKNGQETALNGQMSAKDLPLDQLLNNEQWGPVSLTMDFEANGSSLNDLDANITAQVDRFLYSGYDFSALELQGDVKNGKGDLHLAFEDYNLNLTAQAQVELDSISSALSLRLNVIGADLLALGITQENIKAALELTAEYNGNPKDYALSVHVENGIAVYDREQYQMGELDFDAQIDTLRTQIRVNSDFLKGNLTSNAAPKAIGTALTRQFKSYFNAVEEPLSQQEAVAVEMNLELSPIPIMTQVFLRDINRLDTVRITASYDAANQNLNGEITIPSVMYAGAAIDSLNAVIKGDATNLNFTAGFAALTADPIHIKKTELEGYVNNKELLLDFSAYADQKKLMHIAGELTLDEDRTLLHINPEELLLNGQPWSIPPENEIVWGRDQLTLNKVRLSQNGQELTIGNDLKLSEKEHIGMVFSQFRLQTFASLLNSDEALTSGVLGGELVIENPFAAVGLVADFNIHDWRVMGNALGKLSLKASSQGPRAYDFNLSLKEKGTDLDLTGSYAAAAKGARLNLMADLNRISTKTIQGFSNGAIKEGEGHLTGRVEISGTTSDPYYEGTLAFEGVRFKVATLNTGFSLTSETLDLDTNGIYLDNFQIADANGNNFTLNGEVLTDSFLNPSFDLRLKTTKFQLLNSTKEDNELFYGIASIDADLTMGGDLALPVVKGRFAIRDVTNMTYVVPKTQLDVEERNGVVVFVNRDHPNAILTRTDQEETSTEMTGFDVATVLEISEDADFHIIIDERTGDNLEVSGEAALNLNVAPNGRINLTGRYELNSGHYETSLYNLVNRRFTIQSGSTITWQGNPMDAKLDVTAIYGLETSAAPLMAAVTSGQDASVTGKYRQVLPFMVYLNVDGELLEPELSFGLDMPEDEQGTFGGAVYSRVQQLNQQEAALNKQVFSLLALNRFYPESGSDGSAGGTAALARDNINKVLSGELNAFSDKIFGDTGFEVDFNLDSFTDYQGNAPQDRTQLNINAKKKLFNERLIVTAGSAVDVEGSAQPGQANTPIIGNVSLEYLLSPKGRYRLRGFRKTEYENIIDGQLIVTGLALIFNREFNRFSQLFNPLKGESAQDGTADPKNKEK